MSKIPVYVVDCGGFDVLGIAWRDLAAVAGVTLTAATGPAHIAPGIVSLHDAYRYAETVGARAHAIVIDVERASSVKGYKLPIVPVSFFAAGAPVHTWRVLPHDGWSMIAVLDDGRTLINWRALKLRLDGYTGPRPPSLGDTFDGAPFNDTVDVRDVVETLQQHIGQHWKIPQVLAVLRPLLSPTKEGPA